MRFVRPSHGFFDDLVDVEIKVQVFELDKVIQFIVVVGSAQVTPFVDHKHAAPVSYCHRTSKWPHWDLVKLKGCLQLEVVNRQRHIANACAMAFFDLVAKTRFTFVHFLQAQQSFTQLVLLGDGSQVAQRLFFIIKKAIQILL